MEETNNESIEKKLAYLDETKTLIRAAINNKGQEITSETPFRDYVQKIDNIETGVDTSDATALASDLLKGKTAYNAEGKIEGTLELKDGDVKLFETEEEMQSDPNAKEGDLAIVYREEIQSATVDSKFQTAIFPETVVLDEAITDYVDIRYRATDSSVMFDCWGWLDSSNFMMDCYSESGEVRIEYTSSDGITYTRTDTLGNPVDFGTEIYYEHTEMWNDVIGKFIQCEGNTFDGLYEFGPYTDKTSFTVPKLNSFSIIDNTMVFDNNFFTSLDIDRIKSLITDYVIHPSSTYILSWILHNEDTWYLYVSENKSYGIYFYPTINGDVFSYVPNGSTFSIKRYKLDINNNTVTYLDNISFTQTTGTYMLQSFNTDIVPIPVYIEATTICVGPEGNTIVTVFSDTDRTYNYSYKYQNTVLNKYNIALTQLTLSNANELLPGKIAYGKNGIIEGDNSIYDNLNIRDVLFNTLGIDVNIECNKLLYNISNDGTKTFINTEFEKGNYTMSDNGNDNTILFYNALQTPYTTSDDCTVGIFLFNDKSYAVGRLANDTSANTLIVDVYDNISKELINTHTFNVALQYKQSCYGIQVNDNLAYLVMINTSGELNLYRLDTDLTLLDTINTSNTTSCPYLHVVYNNKTGNIYCAYIDTTYKVSCFTLDGSHNELITTSVEGGYAFDIADANDYVYVKHYISASKTYIVYCIDVTTNSVTNYNDTNGIAGNSSIIDDNGNWYNFGPNSGSNGTLVRHTPTGSIALDDKYLLENRYKSDYYDISTNTVKSTNARYGYSSISGATAGVVKSEGLFNKLTFNFLGASTGFVILSDVVGYRGSNPFVINARGYNRFVVMDTTRNNIYICTNCKNVTLSKNTNPVCSGAYVHLFNNMLFKFDNILPNNSSSPITEEEYNTALDTAYSIRDDQVE